MKLVGKGNAGPPTLAAAVESGVGEFRVVAQNHEVHRSDGQQRIRTTVGSSELDFEGRTVIGHDNGAYLTATQEDVLAAFEVLRGGIFQKRDNVMHLDLAVHPLHYKAGGQPWKAFPSQDNPGAQDGRASFLSAHLEAQNIGVAKATISFEDRL